MLEDEELRELWSVLVKYFDGRHAIEDISVREGLKKKKVHSAMSKFVADGYVVTVRHW
jgi:hypothetical protein